MGTLQGEVAFVNERSAVSKKTGKPFKAYSLKLRLENGNLSEPLEAGFDRPAVSQGDYVTVVVEKNGRGYDEIKSLAVTNKPTKQGMRATPPSPAAPAAPAEAASGEAAPADRQTQIVLQHSQEMAIAEVALLIEHGALPLSSAANKAGVTKRYAEITGAIEKLTVQRYFDVVSARLLETVADAGEIDTSADGEIPAAPEVAAEDDE